MRHVHFAGLLLTLGCVASSGSTSVATSDAPYVIVLGVAQDGGYPQAGTGPGDAWNPDRRRLVASLGIIDPASGERWLIEATPDFREQLHLLDLAAPGDRAPGLSGILLTHAHIGHYTGLMQLGHEVMGAQGVPVYAMPRMRRFLSTNGPWDQLVRFRNIELRPLEDGRALRLNERISITPFLVPHRDEYSETVGFRIEGPTRTVIFLPDIDKWERWDVPIEDVVAGADVAWLDGTFHMEGEIPGRDMAQIPHPFIVETMARFATADPDVRGRIRFIHLNRTNPVLWEGSDARRSVERAGFRVAGFLERVQL